MRVEAKLANGVGKSLSLVSKKVTLQAGSRGVMVELDAADAALWSEFDPAPYEVSAVFTGGGTSASKTEVLGIRSVETDGRQILVNGSPTFFRGTLECSIAPRTGYPATTVEGWLGIFGQLRITA